MSLPLGTIIRSKKSYSQTSNMYGVVVGIYGTREVYESDFCAVFPKLTNLGKYTKYTFSPGEYSVVPHDRPNSTSIDVTKLKAAIGLRDKLFSKMTNNLTGETMSPVKFLILNMNKDINHQLGLSNNMCESREEAVERCKEFIIKYPSAIFHIFEAIAIVKPKTEVDIVELKPQLISRPDPLKPS